ncbi:MAG: GntR family transcriptional regulator [Collinsella sp.]|nr:GntR family transcriptional regulator [Collinsella sp.]
MRIRNAGTQTLYHQLAEELRGKIASGAYPTGSKLPSESELMDDTGLSRSTVRRALASLVEDGLISTERGRGAFVTAQARTEAGAHLFHSLTDQFAGTGDLLTTKTVDARLSPAGPDAAAFFGVDEGEKLVQLVRIRYLNGMPLCLEESLLSREHEALLDSELDGSLYDVLQRRFGETPARGRKEFEAHVASQRDAFMLDVPRGTALIRVVDYVFDTARRPLHISRRTMRTDQAKYVEPIGASDDLF